MSQPRRGRDRDGEYLEVVAPGVLDLPDELPVTFNWGPRIGTAKLTADGQGVTAAIRFDGPAGQQGADALLRGDCGGLSFQVERGVPTRAVVVEPPTAPLDPADTRWRIVSGHRHRHAERNRDQLVGWREHSHLGGGAPHRHDAETGAQIPVGCDPDRCRYPFGSHAETCRP